MTNAIEDDEIEVEDFLKQCGDIIITRDWLQFKFSHAFSLQLSYKIFMNTFYGVVGSYYSGTFYCVQMAGGVTTLGKENTLRLNQFLKNKDCKVWYNDTDSAYFSPPPKLFTEIDKKYYSGDLSKIDYCTKLVEMTQLYADGINSEVNDYFINTSGYTALKLNYEEVLYPCMWTAKKKYFGHEHKELVNFISELFIRGLTVVRRDPSAFVKGLTQKILNQAVDINNTYEIMHLCKKTLFEIYKQTFTKKDFSKNAVYRPNKQNIKVLTFAERMTERSELVGYNMCPAPGERFDYVVVKKDPIFSFRGTKIPLKVGDKMEYLDHAEKNNLEIDMDYYIENEVIGSIARLAAYHTDFYVSPLDETKAAQKKSEEDTFKKAKKYMWDLVKPATITQIATKTPKGKSFKYIETQLKNKILNETSVQPLCLPLLTINNKYDDILKKHKMTNSQNQSNKNRILVSETSKKIKTEIVRKTITRVQQWANAFIKDKLSTICRGSNYKKDVNNCLNKISQDYHLMRPERITSWCNKKNWITNQLEDLTQYIMLFHKSREEFYEEEVDIVHQNIVQLNEDLTTTDDIDIALKELLYTSANMNDLINDKKELLGQISESYSNILNTFEKTIRPDVIMDKVLYRIKLNSNVIDKPKNITMASLLDQYLVIFNA